jgi:hypothetical protein
MNKDIIDFGFKNHYGRLKHWKSLFEEWFLIVKRYCRIAEGDDAPYWYNERANTGILAVAASRCGWAVLEEYQCDKGKGANRKRGSADLWVSSGSNTENIEAKFGFISLASKNIDTYVKNKIKTAKRDAHKVDESSDKIALVFLSAYLPVGKKDKLEDYFHSFKSKLEILIDYDVLAWCFPAETRYLSTHNSKYFYPGVFVVVKKV